MTNNNTMDKSISLEDDMLMDMDVDDYDDSNTTREVFQAHASSAFVDMEAEVEEGGGGEGEEEESIDDNELHEYLTSVYGSYIPDDEDEILVTGYVAQVFSVGESVLFKVDELCHDLVEERVFHNTKNSYARVFYDAGISFPSLSPFCKQAIVMKRRTRKGNMYKQNPHWKKKIKQHSSLYSVIEDHANNIRTGSRNKAIHRNGVTNGVCDYFERVDISKDTSNTINSSIKSNNKKGGIFTPIIDINDSLRTRDYDLVFTSLCETGGGINHNDVNTKLRFWLQSLIQNKSSIYTLQDIIASDSLHSYFNAYNTIREAHISHYIMMSGPHSTSDLTIQTAFPATYMTRSSVNRRGRKKARVSTSSSMHQESTDVLLKWLYKATMGDSMDYFKPNKLRLCCAFPYKKARIYIERMSESECGSLLDTIETKKMLFITGNYWELPFCYDIRRLPNRDSNKNSQIIDLYNHINSVCKLKYGNTWFRYADIFRGNYEKLGISKARVDEILTDFINGSVFITRNTAPNQNIDDENEDMRVDTDDDDEDPNNILNIDISTHKEIMAFNNGDIIYLKNPYDENNYILQLEQGKRLRVYNTFVFDTRRDIYNKAMKQEIRYITDGLDVDDVLFVCTENWYKFYVKELGGTPSNTYNVNDSNVNKIDQLKMRFRRARIKLIIWIGAQWATLRDMAILCGYKGVLDCDIGGLDVIMIGCSAMNSVGFTKTDYSHGSLFNTCCDTMNKKCVGYSSAGNATTIENIFSNGYDNYNTARTAILNCCTPYKNNKGGTGFIIKGKSNILRFVELLLYIRNNCKRNLDLCSIMSTDTEYNTYKSSKEKIKQNQYDILTVDTYADVVGYLENTFRTKAFVITKTNRRRRELLNSMVYRYKRNRFEDGDMLYNKALNLIYTVSGNYDNLKYGDVIKCRSYYTLRERKTVYDSNMDKANVLCIASAPSINMAIMDIEDPLSTKFEDVITVANSVYHARVTKHDVKNQYLMYFFGDPAFVVQTLIQNYNDNVKRRY